jgi:hypothetical protein
LDNEGDCSGDHGHSASNSETDEPAH